MKFLAISGSARSLSTNTALLRAVAQSATSGIAVEVFDGIGGLPVFSPDLEGPHLPASVETFKRQIAECDGLVISSPEYVRTIPGGLKNAIDWLVSSDEVIGKPIALIHASHRGSDMLEDLRKVLATISSGFNPDLFLQLPVMKQSPEAIADIVRMPENRERVERFLLDFAEFCKVQDNSQSSHPA